MHFSLHFDDFFGVWDFHRKCSIQYCLSGFRILSSYYLQNFLTYDNETLQIYTWWKIFFWKIEKKPSKTFFCWIKPLGTMKQLIFRYIFGAKIQLQMKMRETSKFERSEQNDTFCFESTRLWSNLYFEIFFARKSKSFGGILFALDQPDYEAICILKYFWRENSN